MDEVAVNACGEWQIRVNGSAVGSLQSRLARELLVRLSLEPKPVNRDRLLAELRPQAADARNARRRLSQELSRAQKVAGVKLWESTRDHVGVIADCTLSSDVGRFLSAARAEAVLEDDDDEFARLANALRLLGREELLPGHSGEWATALRGELERAEARVLGRVVPLAEFRHSKQAMQWALRRAELDSFDDSAHAAAARQLLLARGPEAAKSYLVEVAELYRRELNTSLSSDVMDALKSAPPPMGNPLLDKVDGLWLCVQRSDAGSDETDALSTLLEIDDLLRQAGHQYRRQAVLDELERRGADPDNTEWRRAEYSVLTTGLSPELARLMDRGEPDCSIESDALLVTLQAMTGASDDETVRRLIEVVDIGPSTRAALEAQLALAFAYDQRQDLVAAEQTLLGVCDLAVDEHLAYYRAVALGALGWNRTRAGDHLEAEGYLQAAIDLGTKIGADGVVADANGGLAHRHYSEHRAGSALRCIEEAADRCSELGRIGSEQRWRRAACTIAHAIGDVPSIRRHFGRLQEIVGQSESASLQLAFTLADIQAILHEYDGLPAEALAIHHDLLERATAAGAHFLAYCSRVEILRQQLELGNNADALDGARILVSYAEDNEVAPPLVTTAIGYLGLALTANGDPASGIDHLRKVVGSSQAGLPALPSHLTAFYEAATTLGFNDEARATAVKASRYLNAVRSDLTDEQWRNATRRKPELRRMVEVLPDFERQAV